MYGCLFLSLTTCLLWPWISTVSLDYLIVIRLLPSEDGQTIGFHGLERSAWENTLLILFNTAVSNLVSEALRCHYVIAASKLISGGGSVP